MKSLQKHIFLNCFFVLFITCAPSKKSKSFTSDCEVFYSENQLDNKAVFNLEGQNFNQYIQNKLGSNYKNENVYLEIKFLLDSRGNIVMANYLSDHNTSNELENQILDISKNCKAWIPGKKNNKNVCTENKITIKLPAN